MTKTADNDKMPPWYAVRTKPGGEYLAETELRRVGVEPYLPQFRREYRHHRSKRWIVRSFPLFQGYILVPATPDWGALSDVDGIARDGVLRDFNGKPINIPDSFVDGIRANVEKGLFDDLKVHGHRLQQGQPIKLSEGVLNGISGVISSVKSSRNARMIISMFNREIVASAPVDMITKSA